VELGVKHQFVELPLDDFCRLPGVDGNIQPVGQDDELFVLLVDFRETGLVRPVELDPGRLLSWGFGWLKNV